MRVKAERVLEQARAMPRCPRRSISRPFGCRWRTASSDCPTRKLRSRSGPIDTDDGERHHIGRRHVEDERGEPVVVDWRAPVPRPSTGRRGPTRSVCTCRRRLAIEGRTVAGLFDEDFTDPDGAEHGASGGVPDPLLAELERARTGRCATSSPRSRPSRT